MAATNVLTAPLLPEAPIMNETPGETYRYIPQDLPPKAPEVASVEVPQEMPQEDTQGSSQQDPEVVVIEAAAGVVEEKSQELTQEIKQEVPQEATQEVPTEAVKVAPQQPPTNKSKPIIPIKSDLAPCDRVAFDPAKHIKFTPPSKVWTMQELDYPEGKGISPVGVSEPFPLFSEEAVKQMRAEILDEKVWDKYKFSSNLSQCQLRGFAPECAPFIYDAWKSPEVLEIISKIAGIDLVPVMDWEIAHINIAVKSEAEKAKELEIVHRNADEGVADCALEEDDKPVVDWHTDSYPFVCVTMLSDCTAMVGGETMLRKGNGGTVKVRGPQMGSAVILQGRYIEHQALRALGAAERITSVTSFRPKSAAVKDDTVLHTVRAISDLKELYHQYAEYRFEILQDRFLDMGRKLRDRKRANRLFDTVATKSFIREQIEFLEAMDREIVRDELVQRGYIDDSHLVSDETRQTGRRKGVYVEETVAA
ncbi:hypothetical protein TMatcc_001641 [Talaromyces marneffei ATCC 18224]|uniref:Fe2OG dioxygenase domain-containing protein n=1 Tax=Talaromyces marneffei (strain ATCC 18224 / CBS 334.59 / QM 7333) TaxID=441960 RepID=B6QHE2_TALMQ|nr:uncharacterized protein EYB26_007150 [Talaromyces marneffei]EEA22787.1 conserved hypothetical protein [Talaromyces marneffei ATCC 18224]KAE8551667.1 hypothetical protein EYB25_005557 [Talaromyces marneffei]QGA19461.1 hypothetical protein EYB26_007150 [Talaromyces marneffei]